MNYLNEPQQQVYQIANTTFNNQPIDLNDYEQGSSEYIIVEFARNSYPLIGAIIQENTIRGQFGYGQIQQPRNERLVLLQKGVLKPIQRVSKIIITKSLVNHKKKQLTNINKAVQQENLNDENMVNQKTIKDRPKITQPYNITIRHESAQHLALQINNNIEQKSNQQQQQQQIEEEQRFFSQSSESNQQYERQQRQAKNFSKKKHAISRNINNKSKTSKLSKNILKKKLKYLADKK